MWQDILLAGGNFALGAALIPTILAAEKPSKMTSAFYAVILASFAAAFITMDMWFASAGVGSCVVLWLVLLIQKFLRRRR